jgi:hypothetical protein
VTRLSHSGFRAVPKSFSTVLPAYCIMSPMFVGHYGVSFAAKALDRRIPLWLLFLAAQLLDILWCIFIYLELEKARVVPGITKSFPLDLYYNPYTHSLVTAFGWGVLVAIGYRYWSRGGARPLTSSLIVGGLVFSHWVLDLIVHRPDLPLYDNSHKVGFGLWNYREAALILETAMLLAGVWLYIRNSKPRSRLGTYATGVVVAGVLLIHASLMYGPPPGSERAAAAMLFIFYCLLAAGAFWAERQRTSSFGESDIGKNMAKSTLAP